jgi:CRP-like cAMP-binding protein
LRTVSLAFNTLVKQGSVISRLGSVDEMAGMTDEDKQEFLGGLSFFSGCTDRQLRDISRLVEERVIPVGTELCREGEFRNEVFVIVEGSADVTIGGRSVESTRVGELIGELSMLGSGRRAATVRSVEVMRVLVLDPEDVDSVLAADPSSAGRLSQHGEPGSE